MSGIGSGIPRSEPRATAARSGTQGCPSAGHLRIARIRWTIPKVNFVCAVSVPVGGAHEETLGRATRPSPIRDKVFWVPLPKTA
jgi:hypothetical protein